MRLLPVSLDALLVELNDLDETLALFEALQQSPVEGVLDMVPAARTVLIQFDPTACSRERLVAEVMRHRGGKRAHQTGTLVQLPLRYDGEDLDEMAAYLKVSREELVRRHSESVWQVAFAGFAPGFAYMTCSDPLFNVPRRSSPRTRIPAGSVGLAGQFCGIYPRATPGGWQLIGTTEVPMWDLNRNPPAFLQPGQRVQFVDAETDAGAEVLARILAGAAGRPAMVPVGAGAGQASQEKASPDFEVLAPGLQAIFQDLGRAGQAGQGVSASGALDRRAFLRANRLVGNHRNAPALELLHGGFRLQVHSAAVMAVTGASGPVQLVHADGTQVAVGRDEPFSVEPGDTLGIGTPEAGLRSYLAVRGGFDVQPVLGSRATDTLAFVGPEPLVAGAPLRTGNRHMGPVVLHPQAVLHDDLPSPEQQTGAEVVTLDIVPGPRADWFSAEALALLEDQSWLVTQQSNRVGLRLQGEMPLARAPEFEGRELASEGTVTGALQIPANGQPVLFLADHPLTGGYPVIACVAPHHLDLAGQLPAGARLRFCVIAPFAGIDVPA
ncbi:MAG: urea amidolyase family protein [Lautropia sp.]|nr:urea amidolyase family protein [Lautropia sp.]